MIEDASYKLQCIKDDELWSYNDVIEYIKNILNKNGVQHEF